MSKILVDHYYHRDTLKLANEVVREFIIAKKLIVTGGLVVDFALRLKGKKIYEDYVVPDYDFFSTKNVRDACELFELLRKKGLTNISLVPGIHPTTIKIFVYKDCVADITFAYESLFEDMKKSALSYDGMLFRNPIIQYVDQHRALSYPYENEPRETINNRWIKDFERFCILYSLYPVNTKTDTPKIMGEVGVSDKFINHDYVSAGLYAVKFYLEKYKITNIEKVDHVYLMDANDRNKFMTKYGKLISDVKTFKSFGELLPKRTEMLIEGIKYTILHCSNKTGVYHIRDQKAVTEKIINKAKLRVASKQYIDENYEYEYSIVSINFCVMYCFSMFMITGNNDYNIYYGMLLKLIYKAYTEGNTDLYPSIVVYGQELENQIILYNNQHPESRVPQVHIASDNSEEENAENIAKLPWDFEYEESIYILDGSEIKNELNSTI